MTWLRSSLVADRAWTVSGEVVGRRGARVSLAGRTQDQLAEVAQAIGGAGGSAITVACDVSDGDSVRSAIATTVETWGDSM